MLGFQHALGIVAGLLFGVIAFAPLLIVLGPVVRHARPAHMVAGFAGLFASFAVLLLGVISTYLLWRRALLVFLVGELAGFFACWAVVAARSMKSRG